MLYQETIAAIAEIRGDVADALGDYAAARANLEEALALFPALGQVRQAAFARQKLARVAQHEGQWGVAASHYVDCLRYWQQDGNAHQFATCLDGLAAVAVGQAEPQRAVRLLAAAATLRERRGIQPRTARSEYDQAMSAVRAVLGETALAEAWASFQAELLEQVIAEALQEAPPADFSVPSTG
jgi:tetratricopeptide (TPR) repeat protein